MARKGGGNPDHLLSPAFNTPTTGWTIHFLYQNDSVPPSSVEQAFVIADTTGNDQFGFSWGHSNAAFRQAFFQQRASTAFDAAKLTSTLSANTPYAIGGRWDGTNLDAFLNGVSEASTASADPAASATAKVTLLASRQGAGSWDDGEIGEAVLYNTDLNDGEMKSLGKGASPALVRPQNIFGYWRIMGNGSFEPMYMGSIGDLTVTGTTKADHPRIFMPSPTIIGIPTAAAPPAAAIINQFQGPNMGADLYNGTLQ